MNIRFGQPSYLGDVRWGSVANLIVEPVARKLSHIVVDPLERHEGARRVRLNQFRVDGDTNVRLELSGAEMRRRPLVRDAVHQRPSRPVLPGRDWDVGIRERSGDVRYPGRQVPREEFDDERTVEIVFDRIPRGTIELRAESRVLLADGSDAGSLYGVATGDEGTISAVFVLRPPRVKRQLSEIPTEAVDRFEMDRVVTTLSSETFSKLAKFGRQRVDRKHPSNKNRA